MAAKRYIIKNKGRTLGRFAVLLLLVLVVIGAAVGVVLLIRSCSVVTGRRSLPFGPSAEFAYTGDGFMYLDGSDIRFISLKDEKKNFTVPSNAASARLMGTSGIKVVYNSRALQILGTQYDIEVSGEIVKLCCGGGYTAAYRRTDDGRGSLRAYDSAGSQCYQIDFTDTILTDFGFESDASPFLWTSQLITSGNTVTTTITVYDLSRSSVTCVLSIQGQLVKSVYMTESSIFAVCTDNIIRYDRRSNAEVYRLLCYGYECTSCSFAGGRALFVLEEDGGNGASVRLLSVSEKEVADEKSTLLMLPDGTLYHCAMNGRFVAVTDGGIEIYNPSGKVLKETPFDIPAASAEKLDETNLLVLRGGDVLMYTIK